MGISFLFLHFDLTKTARIFSVDIRLLLPIKSGIYTVAWGAIQVYFYRCEIVLCNQN